MTESRFPAWRSPEMLLLLMAAAAPLSFATWEALLNNFALERAAFTGKEIGILHSLREVPGFLAFSVVLLLLLMREQMLAYVSLALLGLGTVLTGWFPSVVGLYATTVLMSVGFHYYYTLETSLTLQWVEKSRTPEMLGRLIAAGSLASIVAFGLVWLAYDVLDLDFRWIYLIGGGITLLIAVAVARAYPRFTGNVRQNKNIVLRRRYWLFYALEFMSGARRQIFMVFASFLLVEKFGMDVAAISTLFLLNALITTYLAPKVGRLVGRIGERRALLLEYGGLVFVFTAYAFVNSVGLAATLYVLDHLFFALAIALRTYLQKIADPADIAATAGVTTTINHIAAVLLPAALGFLWLVSPAAVFLCGTAMALVSLVLSMNVPTAPEPGNEVVIGRVPPPGAATDTLVRHRPVKQQ